MVFTIQLKPNLRIIFLNDKGVAAASKGRVVMDGEDEDDSGIAEDEVFLLRWYLF